MSVNEALSLARQIAEEYGIEHSDLVELAPQRQVKAIKDRIARRVLVLQEEMLGITHKRQQAAQRIAA